MVGVNCYKDKYVTIKLSDRAFVVFGPLVFDIPSGLPGSCVLAGASVSELASYKQKFGCEIGGSHGLSRR